MRIFVYFWRFMLLITNFVFFWIILCFWKNCIFVKIFWLPDKLNVKLIGQIFGLFCNNIAFQKFFQPLWNVFCTQKQYFPPQNNIKNYFQPSGFEPVPNGLGATPLPTRPNPKNATRKFLSMATASGVKDRPNKVYIFWQPMIPRCALFIPQKPVSGHTKKFF